MYSQKVIDHFTSPRNMGEPKEWDAVGKIGNPVCGDIMYIYIKVDKQKGVITDIGFKTMGCAAAIATSSMITELAKGRTLDEALRITRNDVADALDGLPPIKMHCSNLAADGLRKAIENYKAGKREGESRDDVLTAFTQKAGLDRRLAEGLWNAGIISADELFRLTKEELLRLPGISEETAERIIRKSPPGAHEHHDH